MVQLTARKQDFENDLYQLDKRGNVVLNRVDAADYGCPDEREYRLRLTGYSEPFEMDSQWGVKTKVRLEFEVLGSKKWNGTRFSTLVNVAWGEMATLPKIIAAFTGKQIKPGQTFDMDDLLGLECYGSVVQQINGETGNVYPKVATYRRATDDDEDDEAPVAPRGKSSGNGGGRRSSTTSDEDDEPPF